MLYVATDLTHFEEPDGDWNIHGMPMPTELESNTHVYRALDLTYYAWLYAQMERLRSARDSKRITPARYDAVAVRFRNIYAWAVEKYGEFALKRAVENGIPDTYIPPGARTIDRAMCDWQRAMALANEQNEQNARAEAEQSAQKEMVLA